VERLRRDDELTVRVRWWMQPHIAGQELDIVKRFIAEVPIDSDDEWLRPLGVGELPLQAIMDGDGTARPAPEFSPEARRDWEELVHLLATSRRRLHVHATRNHTVEQLLPALEAAAAQYDISNRRWYFDHCEEIREREMERIRAIGGGIAFQDRTAFWDSEMFASEEQARLSPPLRRALDIGLPIGGGTDSTRATSYDPFTSLWWMVTGQTVSGAPRRAPQQCLTRNQALHAYTKGSAWFAFDETALGSIEPGKLADLVVLSDDYSSVSDEEIRDLHSLLTVVGGRAVYAAGPFSGLA
jgi:predicted amidohydrolase YtcJ